MMVALTGGRGAAFAAGPGFERLGRHHSVRLRIESRTKRSRSCSRQEPTRTRRRPMALHCCTRPSRLGRFAIIRTLVGAGAKLDAVNKDNLTPLLLAEKPEPPPPPGNNTDSRAYRPKRDSREDVIASLRELMNLGPNDPAPVPPPLPLPLPTTRRADEKKDDENRVGGKEGRREEARRQWPQGGQAQPGTTHDEEGSDQRGVDLGGRRGALGAERDRLRVRRARKARTAAPRRRSRRDQLARRARRSLPPRRRPTSRSPHPQTRRNTRPGSSRYCVGLP